MLNLINNKYQIFNDLVDPETQSYIQSELLHDFFPWYYRETSLPAKDADYGFKCYDYIQFSHCFIDNYNYNSDFIDSILNKLLNVIKIPCEIIRAKANLKLPCPYGNIDKHNKPHYDQDVDHFVGLYYVNNSDGDTWLFNDDKTLLKRISPKKGRMLFFRGDLLHAASHPCNAEKRLVINIDFKKEK